MPGSRSSEAARRLYSQPALAGQTAREPGGRRPARRAVFVVAPTGRQIRALLCAPRLSSARAQQPQLALPMDAQASSRSRSRNRNRSGARARPKAALKAPRSRNPSFAGSARRLPAAPPAKQPSDSSDSEEEVESVAGSDSEDELEHALRAAEAEEQLYLERTASRHYERFLKLQAAFAKERAAWMREKARDDSLAVAACVAQATPARATAAERLQARTEGSCLEEALAETREIVRMREENAAVDSRDAMRRAIASVGRAPAAPVKACDP